MNLRFFSVMALVLIAAVGFQSCGDDNEGENPTPAPTKNSMALLEENVNYSTLVDALEKTGMDALLNGSEPYTLFAPDNQMLRDAGIISIETASAEQLRPILEYHLLKGKVLAADLPSNGYRGSENKGGPAGQALSLYFSKNGDLVNINSRHSINTTSASTTGIIHFIGGGALVPPTVFMQMGNNSNLTGFHSAAGVVTNQKSSKKFRDEWNDNTVLLTIFAPNNAAVDAYVAEKNVIIPRMNPIETSKMMNNHVITGSAISSSAIQAGVVSTDGDDMNISGSAGSFTINGESKITVTNVYGTNGVLHIIDKLIKEK